MKRLRIWVGLLAAMLAAGPGYCLTPLQPLIDATPTGGVLQPPAGIYAGPALISRPITLDGNGAVVIDGGGHGTVLTVQADGATVRGVRLTNSGSSHDSVDAGLLVEADDVRIENNTIDDALFGIHLRQANRNTLRGNRIASKPTGINLRGDGIRLWYSQDNLIEGNEVTQVRDLSLTNSSGNSIVGNTVRGSRSGLNVVFSPRNVIERNTLDRNAAGIVVLYSDELVIRANRIQHSLDATGQALAFKDSSQIMVEANDVVHCSTGFQANAPSSPENIIHLRGNRFAHNITGLYFYGENGGHLIHDNRFEKNLVPVAVSGFMSARGNDWRGNYWDDYEGFDRDGDGIGDTPHERYAFADRIWMEIPMATFFRKSPAFELLDFLEQLAPFSLPELILRDPAPRMH
ncbi:MAG: nitrous oxide reductase family maturation protein NosD [Thiohalomonadaceae bacterium]